MAKATPTPLASAFAGLIMAGTLALAAQPARSAQGEAPIATAALVNDLARQLEETFVFPDVAGRYAAALKAKLASGAYAGIADPGVLAKTLTADLQAVAKDGHLQVFPPRGDTAGNDGPRRPRLQPITASGWLADGIAYINFAVFPGDAETLKQLDAFIAAHAGARVLIIDARGHHGGGIAEMDHLFPQMFTRRTPLVTMDARAAVETRLGPPPYVSPAMEHSPSPADVVRRIHVVTPAAKPVWANTQVFLLTSHRTASAAEHMALALKRTHRATLVGETTMGAGNFGMEIDLPNGFSAFVPFGRSYDPETGQGWEGTGIAPDVAVPATEALPTALKLAGVDPASVRPLPGVS